MTREERIQQMMEVFGMSRTEAEFAVDVQDGEIDGDVEDVEDTS